MTSQPDSSQAEAFASSRRRVLVVEDEFLIRAMISDELREAGFDVIEAGDADEAVAILQTPVAIDIMFSDVRMPGSMDGLELLAFVREAIPTLPVILTSGHLEAVDVATKAPDQFLSKPYRFDVVIKAVEEQLARPA